MRSRMLVGALLFVGILAVASHASTGSHMAAHKQWAIVNFADPVSLNGHLLMGQYLVAHDDAKMARGEACTSIYRFDAKKGPQEAVVDFMCKPVKRGVCEKTTFTASYDPALGIKKVTEYQFAGDPEAHGIPAR